MTKVTIIKDLMQKDNKRIIITSNTDKEADGNEELLPMDLEYKLNDARSKEDCNWFNSNSYKNLSTSTNQQWG